RPRVVRARWPKPDDPTIQPQIQDDRHAPPNLPLSTLIVDEAGLRTHRPASSAATRGHSFIASHPLAQTDMSPGSSSNQPPAPRAIRTIALPTASAATQAAARKRE